MAIYKRLSVAAGGGVIDNFHKAQGTDALNICIGLGGTGADMIKALKKEVYSHIRPDDESAVIPHYKNIQFLVIDSDDDRYFSSDRNIWDIDPQEYFSIFNGVTLRDMFEKKSLKERAEMSWLNYEAFIRATEVNGSEPFRQAGRFLLINRASALRTKLIAIIQDMTLKVRGDINIHIFSGISGCTGGGIFIDVCYIVQNVLEILGKAGESKVCGYFFLPDVNLSRPGPISDPLWSDSIRVNGYAALKELDYLMSLKAENGRFRQSYGTFSIDTEKPPVDFCYLISSTTVDGVSVADGYNYSLSVVTSYVMRFLIRTEFIPVGHLFEKKCLGPYMAINASEAIIPYSDIATYLGAKLFEHFDFMYNQVPAENQLMEFVTKNQLGYEQILGALTKGIAFHVPFPKYDPKDLIASNKQPIDRCDDWIAGARGKLQENRKNMEEKLRDYKIPENSTSLIARIYLDLYTNYACDAKYGPFFAMRLLGGMNNKNMLHVIDGYVQKNDSLMAAEVRQEKLREDDLKNAEAQLKNAHTGLFGNAEKRSQEYLGTLNNWYVHLANIEKYKYMQSLLRTLREQVVELNNNFFDVLTTVLDTIKNTFEDNARILTAGVRPTANTCTWKILDIPDIQGQLDAVVDELDADQVMRNFVGTMFDRYPEWLGQDADKITILLSEFITEQFSSIMQQTIKNFLEIKYATTDPVILQKNIKDDIIEKRLDAKTNPLFWKDPILYWEPIVKRKTVFTPYYPPEVIEAAKEFGCCAAASVQRSGITDRISMTTVHIGFPLWGYGGIEELKNIYQQYCKSGLCRGLHLYEGEELDWRTTLPDIDMKPQDEENGYFY